jgi:hypothetical protein
VMKTKKSIIKHLHQFLILALLMSALSPIISLRGTENSTEELDIIEAVFRYEFQRNCFWETEDATYFIAIEGKDPDEAFMKRFKDNKPPVKKLSQRIHERGVAKDKETGKPGVIFEVGKPEMTNIDSAKVSGGVRSGPDSGSGNTYYLKLVKGKWVVNKVTNFWVS